MTTVSQSTYPKRTSASPLRLEDTARWDPQWKSGEAHRLPTADEVRAVIQQHAPLALAGAEPNLASYHAATDEMVAAEKELGTSAESLANAQYSVTHRQKFVGAQRRAEAALSEIGKIPVGDVPALRPVPVPGPPPARPAAIAHAPVPPVASVRRTLSAAQAADLGRRYQDVQSARGIEVEAVDAIAHVLAECDISYAPEPAVVTTNEIQSEARAAGRALADKAIFYQQAQSKLGLTVTGPDALAYVLANSA